MPLNIHFLGCSIDSSPVIGSDGAIYFLACAWSYKGVYYLYSLESSGVLRWKVELGKYSLFYTILLPEILSQIFAQ